MNLYKELKNYEYRTDVIDEKLFTYKTNNLARIIPILSVKDELLYYKEWFNTEEINSPSINDDTSYKLTTNNHKITVVNYLNVDKIYKDLFEKLEKN